MRHFFAGPHRRYSSNCFRACLRIGTIAVRIALAAWMASVYAPRSRSVVTVRKSGRIGIAGRLCRSFVNCCCRMFCRAMKSATQLVRMSRSPTPICDWWRASTAALIILLKPSSLIRRTLARSRVALASRPQRVEHVCLISPVWGNASAGPVHCTYSDADADEARFW